MRVTPGSTLDEVYSSLSKRQQNRVEAVETARSKEAEQIKSVQNKSREAVRRALEVGVPARILADRLGVSPARVYQMRDEAQAFKDRAAGA